MGLADLNIVDNLVYGVFGEPAIFSLIVSMIFLFFAMQYDIPKWVSLSFFIPLFTWITFHYMPTWAAIILILFVAIIVGSKFFRSTSG